MFLKALTLKGFKSFAEKTDLTFEPGVTVVVGPNGSGKSNLVDAIAWVLGAQGARALRGAKMDDVIFAGTTKKPALGRAEVSLTIDNADGTLPIEFTEVTITRTLFRSGESEYRLNDVPCRLLDIQELLSDSRIGRTQHVIVGQGQLDSVLNARPEDRRAIIEEAAGVLKYRKRREKAQRRLESTEGNLTRLGDLVREVRRQLTPLQKQADAAKRHDGVRDELNAIRLFLTGKEIKGLQATQTRIENERIELLEKEKSVLSRLSELDISVLEAEAALMKVGDSDVAQWLSRAEKLVSRTGATKSMLAERKRSILLQLDSSADDSVIESLLSEKAELENAIAELENSSQVLEPTLNSLHVEFADFEKEFEQFEKTAPSQDIAKDYENLLKEKKIHEDNLAVLRDRLDADIARLASIRQRIEILSRDNEDANDVVAAESKSLDEMVEKHTILISNVKGLKELVASKQIEKSKIQDKASKAKAHYEVMLEAFESDADNAGIEQVRTSPGVLGTLVENISIDEKYIDAVSVILEEMASSIVVDGNQNAKEVLAKLSANDLKANLFVVGEHGLNDEVSVIPEGAKPISELIRCTDEKLSETLRRVLRNVVVVNGDWKSACDISISHPELIVISSNGDRFSSNSAWSLGKTSKRTITAESVEDAGRQADNYARLFEEISQELDSAVSQKEAIENQEREIQNNINEINSRFAIAQQTQSATQSGIQARNSEASKLETQISELKMLVESEQQSVEDLRASSIEMADMASNEEAAREVYENKKRELLDSKLRLQNEIRRLEIDQERIHTRLKDSKARMESVLIRLAKDPEQEKIAIERRAAHLALLENIDNLTQRTIKLEENAVRAQEVLSQERQRQTQRAQESTSILEGLRVDRRNRETELTQIRGSLQKGEITEAETKTRLLATIESLRANFDCEPQVAIDAPEPELIEGTTFSARARELERDLKLMGPINPLAVQEYDELNERHVFLNQQLDDVKASRKELHKVIKTIDTEIVTVFEKAFEDVQKHFTDLFSTLFAGGAGRLTLTDPTDMLNTGIEMEARPSGKNVRRLSLLSGGERSLTALAFLFAVFRSRPSPFYVMDEVEAALDEPNLMRFLDLVAEFRHDAQLLIVSHQKKTMEAADELYGVTMAPGGSSRAIKQRIEKPVSQPAVQSGENVIDLVSMEEDQMSDTDEKVMESSI